MMDIMRIQECLIQPMEQGATDSLAIYVYRIYNHPSLTTTSESEEKVETTRFEYQPPSQCPLSLLLCTAVCYCVMFSLYFPNRYARSEQRMLFIRILSTFYFQFIYTHVFIYAYYEYEGCLFIRVRAGAVVLYCLA